MEGQDYDLEYKKLLETEADKIQVVMAKFNNKEITVRVPSEIREGNLQLGNGYAIDQSISWNYSNTIQNSSIKYTEWSKINSENIEEEFVGYEFKVAQTGWYSLSVINDTPNVLQDVCIEIENNNLNSDNSLVYILSNTHQYLLQAQAISTDEYCSYNVPVTGNALDIIAISYIESEDQFYYDSKRINPNEIESTLSLSPQQIDKETLESTLYNL